MKTTEWLKKPLFWLVSGMILAWLAVFQLPDNRLRLIFCDVGQGDAILISYKDQQVLIDGGPNNQVLDCLADHLPFYDRTIEMVVATHPEDDHITGLTDVIKRYNINHFVINSIAKDSAVFQAFHQAVLEEEAPVYSPQAGDRLKIGPVQLAVLWPEEKLGDPLVWNSDYGQSAVLGTVAYSGEVNDTSIVFKLSFGDFDVLLPGDLSTKVENDLAASDVDVLKVSHHGSKYSTSQQFLESFKPELAVISVGKNSYGHPTSQILDELKQDGIETLRTDRDGEVEIVSDGKTWQLIDKK